MSLRSVLGHVRRYPRWYAVAVVWLVAMLALPVVELDPLGARTGEQSAPIALEDTPVTAGGSAAGPRGGSGSSASGLDAGTGGGDVVGGPTDEGAPTTTAPADLELVPQELLDAIFDIIPPPVVPPLPPELASLARAIAPIATYGCSGLGLASIVVAVVAQSAEGVPVGRLLPYLAPVSSACASFPIPEVHTVCSFDEPFIIDVGGLATGPPILGLGIDQLEAIERSLAQTFGQSLPPLAPQLRAALDCQVVGPGA